MHFPNLTRYKIIRTLNEGCKMGKLVIPLTDEHLRSLGKITANFALLEALVSLCIWTLIGGEQRLGQITTAELSFSQKVTLLSSLYRYRVNSAEESTELKGLLSRIAQAEEKRNAITHSVWAAGRTKETVTRIKTTAKRSTGLKFHFQQMSVQDLDEFADFIAEVAYDVQTFTIRMHDPNFRK